MAESGGLGTAIFTEKTALQLLSLTGIWFGIRMTYATEKTARPGYIQTAAKSGVGLDGS